MPSKHTGQWARSDAEVLAAVRAQLRALKAVKKKVDDPLYGGADGMYRFYHHRYPKVLGRLQPRTEAMVTVFERIFPGFPLNRDFLRIVREGTGKPEPTDWAWNESEARRIVEAYLHASFFLDLLIDFAEGKRKPGPQGDWLCVRSLLEPWKMSREEAQALIQSYTKEAIAANWDAIAAMAGGDDTEAVVDVLRSAHEPVPRARLRREVARVGRKLSKETLDRIVAELVGKGWVIDGSKGVQWMRSESPSLDYAYEYGRRVHPAKDHKHRWHVSDDCGDDVCRTCGYHRAYETCSCALWKKWQRAEAREAKRLGKQDPRRPPPLRVRALPGRGFPLGAGDAQAKAVQGGPQARGRRKSRRGGTER